VDELSESVDEARRQALPFFVLGGGTNILWSDSGFDGLVLKPIVRHLSIEGGKIKAGGGVLVSELVEFAVLNSLSGLEWAGGLPGTLGGALRGNAGAFGGEIKDAVEEVVSLDTATLKVIRRNIGECSFGYRNSIFKTTGVEVVVEAVLSLRKGDRNQIQKATEDNINYRRTKHPMEYPNIGSIFKNVSVVKYPHLELERFARVIKQDPFQVIPTAFLVSESGLRGVSCGGAMISPKHPNFIVNVLSASSRDVKNLIKLAKSEIFDKFGVELEEEIEILDSVSE